MPNEGQISVNFEEGLGGGETNQLRFVCQVADMMRPLMSVSQICDQGFKCVFTTTHALVMNSEGRTMCKFDRQSGLYVAKLRLRQSEFLAGRASRSAPSAGVARKPTRD